MDNEKVSKNFKNEVFGHFVYNLKQPSFSEEGCLCFIIYILFS